jgi:hypothetical protein
MAKDNNKVVKLRQPTAPSSSAGATVDEAIQPKSILNMTELEQETFLNVLRDRRMRAAEILKQAQATKHKADTIASEIRLERKADQAEKQLDKVTKALDKLEEMIYSLRALHLQYTDVDITKTGGE